MIGDALDAEVGRKSGEGASDTGTKARVRKRDKLRSMAGALKKNLKKMAGSSPSPAKQQPTPAAAAAPPHPSPADTSGSDGSGSSRGAGVRQSFIGSDNYTVSVTINGTAVPALSMR